MLKYLKRFIVVGKADNGAVNNVEPTVTTFTTNTTNATPSDPKPSGSVNFEELIAKARKEEKDKLYPEITSLKSKNNDLLLVIGERDKKIAELDSKISELEKQVEESTGKVSASKSKEISELRATISKLEADLEISKRDTEEIKTRSELELYKVTKISQAGAEVIPELVSGSTREEIDAAIEASKQRYQEIISKATGGVRLPNPSTTKLNETFSNKTPEDIRKMSREEYAEFRKQVLKG